MADEGNTAPGSRGRRLSKAISEFRKSSRLNALFLTGFGLVIVLVALGIYVDSKEADFKFRPVLEGLYTNGISVILSAILIAPLIAYFIYVRQESQLEPVRRSFIESLGVGIERIATAQLHLASHIDVVGASLSEMGDYLTKTTAHLEHRQDITSPEVESLVSKAIARAASIASTIQKHYDVLYRETQGIENTLTFAMPLFPVHAVRDLHKIRELLMEYRGRLQDMLAVLAACRT